MWKGVTLLSLLVGFCHQAEPVNASSAELQTLTPKTLTVCLPRNGGVMSGRRLTGGSGFDYAVSTALAEDMGLSLSVVWIENELDEESDPIRETYALLAYGLCDAVPGHPRYESSVGAPDFARASLPRWLDMPQEIDPDTGLLKDTLAGFVDVFPVAVTEGYMRSEIGMLYRKGGTEPEGLQDRNGRKVAVQQGTLSGAIATVQVAPSERADIVTLNPGAGFLWDVETSGYPLALVDVAAFDAHRKAFPATSLQLANWRHPIGMDIGIAVLADNAPLQALLNSAIKELLISGDLPGVAAAEGLTYAAPQSAHLMPALTLATLRAMR
jgi:hypothetical protein